MPPRRARQVLISVLTQDVNWAERAQKLPGLLAKLPGAGSTLATVDVTAVTEMVAFGIWYLIFGVQLTAEQRTVRVG